MRDINTYIEESFYSNTGTTQLSQDIILFDEIIQMLKKHPAATSSYRTSRFGKLVDSLDRLHDGVIISFEGLCGVKEFFKKGQEWKDSKNIYLPLDMYPLSHGQMLYNLSDSIHRFKYIPNIMQL